MLSADDIQGLYGIIPTPALEGAQAADADNTVNLPETERLVNKLIADGVSGLIVLGTTGECPTLSRNDYESFVSCVLETVGKRIPTFVGATALGTHEVVSRLRFAQDLGASGSLLGLPMWQPLTQDMAIRFYQTISEVFPDLALMVYANMRAFRFDFTPEFWGAALKVAPTIVAAKCSNARGLAEALRQTSQKVNFMPSDMVVHEFFRISPETTMACWATAAGMGPAPSLEIMKALQQKNMQAIDDWANKISWANDPILEIVKNPEVFASYNIQIEKVRISEAGYCAPGPIRPPYDVIPPEYESLARECGRRWAILCHHLATAKSV